ncbi:SpoIIE family protein phosphatase [Streptomyces sp. ISID311]|nr:SpoIIE family protein phosphatase [Streptomyces sp. ISID311]
MDALGSVSWDEASWRGEAARLVVDARGHVTAWSDGAERLLGYSADEAIGRRAAELLMSKTLTRTVGGDWHGLVSMRCQDGGRLLATASVHEVNGYWEWLLTSPTPEWLSSDAADQALSDWLVAQSPVAMAVYDSHLLCVRQNEAMRRLTGMADEDRLGRGVAAVLKSAQLPEYEERMRSVLKTGHSAVDFLVRGRTPADLEHERIFSASVSPLQNRHGHVVGVCTTVIDITEQHRSRERLALLYEASTYIGNTLDVERTAQELAEVAVPRLADFVSIDLLEGLLSGDDPMPVPVTHSVALRRVAQNSVLEGVPESVTAVGDADFYSEHSPPARCMATGESEVHNGIDAAVGRWMAEDPARGAKIREYGFHSWIIAPLTARGTTSGVVFFGRWRRQEHFDSDDLNLAEELVARAAICLDNARRFTNERTYARALQCSLLPRRLPETSAVDTASRYVPADSRFGVGGDWYDVIPLPGARVALVVGDVPGSGLPAATAMGQLRSAVRTLADVDLAPDELLTQLDDLVIRLAAESGTDEAAGGTAAGATCLYAVYDPISGRCSVARAGHPGPALVHPDRTVEFLRLPSGPRLGVGGLPFETVDVELPAGSVLALFTDGLLSAGTHGAEEARDVLRRALAAPATSLDGCCDQVVQSLLPDRPAADDAALLLVRPRLLGTDRVASWTVPADPAEVAEIRAEAGRQLEDWGLEEAGFVTELVVSELVTNAIRYGAGPIQLRLIHDRTLICEVSDASSTAPHLRRARIYDEGGRGLLLVVQLTDRWGSRQHARGKTIWCEQGIAPKADGSDQGTLSPAHPVSSALSAPSPASRRPR